MHEILAFFHRIKCHKYLKLPNDCKKLFEAAGYDISVFFLPPSSSGRIDRKIEFPLPDEKTKRRIFQIHTSRMTVADDVTLDDLILAKDDLSGADIKVRVALSTHRWLSLWSRQLDVNSTRRTDLKIWQVQLLTRSG